MLANAIIYNKNENNNENEIITTTPIQNSIIISTKQYFENPSCIEKCKMTDLRDMLRHYKKQINFKLSSNYYSQETSRFLKDRFKNIYDFALIGNKPKILERVIRYFHLEKGAINIQRHLRGYFVRLVIKLRGPAIKDRSLCVNETDFYSLEPIRDIPHNEFFSYMDDSQFVYGFELNSLLTGIKHRSHKMLNPYTRNSMDKIIPNIKKIYRIQQIINKQENMKSKLSSPTIVENQIHLPQLRAIELPATYNTSEMVAHIRNMRSKPVLERIHALFMEMDQLGHYTDANWFIQLEYRDCLRYFRYLYDIWHHRAGLSIDIKMKICPLWDPFVVMVSNQFDHRRYDMNEIRLLCVSVIEDMIYTGIDNEYRMLGAFHVLSALTIVSPNARNSMMWLYESLT